MQVTQRGSSTASAAGLRTPRVCHERPTAYDRATHECDKAYGSGDDCPFRITCGFRLQLSSRIVLTLYLGICEATAQVSYGRARNAVVSNVHLSPRIAVSEETGEARGDQTSYEGRG